MRLSLLIAFILTTNVVSMRTLASETTSHVKKTKTTTEASQEKAAASASATPAAKTSPAAIDGVNYDDPNLRVTHEYVADAVTVCLAERGNSDGLRKCLMAQGLTETDDLTNAIQMIRATIK